MMSFCIKNDGFCIKNDGFCVKHDVLNTNIKMDDAAVEARTYKQEDDDRQRYVFMLKVMIL